MAVLVFRRCCVSNRTEFDRHLTGGVLLVFKKNSESVNDIKSNKGVKMAFHKNWVSQKFDTYIQYASVYIMMKVLASWYEHDLLYWNVRSTNSP